MLLTDIQVGLVAFFVALVVMQLVLKFVSKKHKYNDPPGPWGLPVVGNMFKIGLKAHLSLTAMSKKYGNIFQIYMGSQRTVVISGLETIRKALLEDSTTFAGRFELWSLQFLGEKMLGFDNYDDRHRLHRRIAKRAL